MTQVTNAMLASMEAMLAMYGTQLDGTYTCTDDTHLKSLY